jgi:hypothetical protein
LYNPGTAVHIQAKLEIGAVNDPLEREADVIAERVVSSMNLMSPHTPHTSTAPRGAPVSDGETVRRKCDVCVESEDEQVRVQRSAAANVSFTAPSGPSGLAGQLRQARGGGRPLEVGLRRAMERGFGVDFSAVRIHSDDAAADVARRMNARAFTAGHDVFFNRGELRPMERGGQLLLAHELTHVVQQRAASRSVDSRRIRDAGITTTSPARPDTIQRKVIVGKEPLPAVDSSRFTKFLRKHDLVGLTKILTAMHESAGIVQYESVEDLEMDARFRNRMNVNLRSVEKANAALFDARWSYDVAQHALRLACCAYPDADFQDANYYLNPQLWSPASNTNIKGEALKEGQSMEADFGLLPGGDGAHAVSRIFKPSATSREELSRLDCSAMMTAVHYKALLDLLGPEVFNTLFAKGLRIAGFKAKEVEKEHPLVTEGLFERVLIPFGAADPTRHLVPGDRVYFQNNKYMERCSPTSIWRGEHALYLGNKQFVGFGVGATISYDKMIKDLHDEVVAQCKELNKKPRKTAEEQEAVTAVLSPSFAEKDIVGLNNVTRDFFGWTAVWRLNPKRLRLLLKERLGRNK